LSEKSEKSIKIQEKARNRRKSRKNLITEKAPKNKATKKINVI